MSVQIWTDIRDAVKEIAPEHSKEFELCRDRDTICAFLEKHFPLPEGAIWSTQTMSATPTILRQIKKGIAK